MQIFAKPPKTLRTKDDIARLVGLPAGTRRAEIADAFGRAVNFDALLQIEDDPVEIIQSETWEIRVIQDLPKCRLELRLRGRGAWVCDAAAIPADILRILEARADRKGSIITNRKWKSWSRLSWANVVGRRLKSRKGELVFVAEIPNIRRDTGERLWRLRLDPIGAPCPDSLAPVQISLPCSGRDLMDAMEGLRSAFQRQIVQA
jgi:hypothetical protein